MAKENDNDYHQLSPGQNLSSALSTTFDHTRKAEEYADAIAQKREPGYAALGLMEKHLANHSFFVGERYTIADIGLFAYTHVADEGGFDLKRFPGILSWIERVKAQPRYISL